MIVYGFHAVASLFHANIEIRAVHFLRKKSADRLDDLDLRSRKIPLHEYSEKERGRFDAEFKRLGGNNEELDSAQGIFAVIAEVPFVEHLELLTNAKEKEEYPLVLYLDSLTDPQNLGAILRSAAFFGIAGVVVTEARSSPITPTVIKISSGGFAHVPIAKVSNLVSALEAAKELGFWTIGLSEHATAKLAEVRFDAPLALVIGNEESGIRSLTSKTCDYLISLPGHGNFVSLNASTAAAVAMTLVRDRQTQAQNPD